MADAGDESIERQIRRARGKFAAMAATYSLGVFNDQFFKQAAMLLALDLGMQRMQGWATVVFTLPYLVLAAPAGWLADRFAKRKIVMATKALELAAMLCGLVGMYTGNWVLILTMVSTMGLQSAMFGPALNGSIPELYPASYVTKANGMLKVVVTAAILMGVASAGLVKGWRGPTAVGLVAVGVSVLGVLGSFGVPWRPAADPKAAFPWAGPAETVRTLIAAARDGLLAVVILANAYVWSLGALQILIINMLGKEQLGYGDAATSALAAAELIGIAAGGLLAGRLAKGERWHGVLAPAALGLAGAMLLIPAAVCLPPTVRLPALLGLLAVAGAFGGLFMIPCESFIQVRPPAERKGAVIAASNFVVFSGILLAGPLGNAMNDAVQPSVSFGCMGAVSLAVAFALPGLLPRRQRP